MFCNSWPSILCFLEKLAPSDNFPTVMGEGLLTATSWSPTPTPCLHPLPASSGVTFPWRGILPLGMHLHSLSANQREPCMTLTCDFFLSVGISYIHLFLKVRIWIVIRIGIILLSLSNHSLTDRSWGFLEKRNQNWLVRLHLSSLFTLKQTGPVGQGKSGLNLHCHIVVRGLGLWHTLGFESHFLLL